MPNAYHSGVALTRWGFNISNIDKSAVIESAIPMFCNIEQMVLKVLLLTKIN